MWETLLLEVMKNVVVPEVARFMRQQYESTGSWPTKEELEQKVFELAQAIRDEGTEFLKRNENFVSELPVTSEKSKNKAENSDA